MAQPLKAMTKASAMARKAAHHAQGEPAGWIPAQWFAVFFLATLLTAILAG